MKVMLVALHFAEYAVSLAQHLSQYADVLLIVSAPNLKAELGERFTLPSRSQLKVIQLPHDRSIKILFKNTAQLIRLVHAFQPDIIHAQEEPKDYQALASWVFTRYPFVLTVHDPRPHSGSDAKSRGWWSRRAFYIWSQRRIANAAIVHGHFLQTELAKSSPWLANQVFSIPHGPLGLLQQKATEQMVLGQILFFGRMEAYKGLKYFVEAIRILRHKGYAVTGVIAGRGPDLDSMKSSLIDDKAFILMDKYLSSDEVITCFDHAQIIALPYVDGTQSGVAAYAIGRGRPVVATRVGSLPEMIHNDETGLIIPPSDVDALVKALEQLVNDAQLASTMGKASQRLGQGAYSWANIAKQTYAVYEQVISQRISTQNKRGV